MTDRISNNPYRVLGLYVGCTPAEEARNRNRIAAYARVGQTADFVFPIDGRLAAVARDEQAVEQASQILALPKDRIANALFWISDGPDPWCRQLNEAVGAVLDGDILKAIGHYSNLIYDQRNLSEFLEASARGMLNLPAEEVEKMLVKALLGDESRKRFVEAVIEADRQNRLSEIVVGQMTLDLFIEVILPEFDNLKTTVETAMTANFYGLFDETKQNAARLKSLLNFARRIYGEDNPMPKYMAEELAKALYKAATHIVESVSHWVWLDEKGTIKDGRRVKFVSNRRRKSVELCMAFLAGLKSYIDQEINSLNLDNESKKTFYLSQHAFETLFADEYTDNPRVIRKATIKKAIRQTLSDIGWLAILALIFSYQMLKG